MPARLRILMISHHRRAKAHARPHVMARHLVQRGHEVTLIVTSDRRKRGLVESDWDGVRVVETPDLLPGRLRSGWDPWNLANRARFLGREREPYDLVHLFETRPATIYPALLYCRRRRVPFVTDWNDWWGRGGIIDEIRPKWYRLLFGGIETFYEEAFRARAAGLTVISTALARRATGLGVPDDRISVIPGGTLPDFFLDRPREECCRRVGLDPQTPILGFSSLDNHWDLDVVMKSLAIVARTHPDVKLLITGRTDASVVELARAHGVADNLFLTGFLPMADLPWYLGCASLFVLPFPETVYNVGRWPNKLGDYLSLGRPTVTNPVGDVGTLFERYQVGLIARSEPADFAAKMLELLANPQLAATLGRTAREVATSIYDWRILVVRLEEFYRRVLGTADRPVTSAERPAYEQG
jgi:glycosyltransferase involved in cell wall biosynthesis